MDLEQKTAVSKDLGLPKESIFPKSWRVTWSPL